MANKWLRTSDVTMHFEHKAGDKMFVDYAGEKLHLTEKSTGELRQVEVFVAILGASQLTYVEAVASQRKEDFIASVENAIHYFGGVPQAIAPDNLKSAVTKPDRYEPDLNNTFADFGLAQLDTHSRLDLLEIMEDRYGKSSTIITSQLPITKWHDVIADSTIADAILDRLVHNAHRIELKGASLRKQN